MKNSFRPDSGLMITMAQVTDCIFLSLFFILGCVPVVTVGASFAALYDAAHRGFRQGEKNSWQRFLHVFWTNWKAGIVPTLAFFAAVCGLADEFPEVANKCEMIRPMKTPAVWASPPLPFSAF